MKLFRNTFFYTLLSGLIFIITSQFILAQDVNTVEPDTLVAIPQTIALADISIESGEGFITTKKTAESLISDEQLNQIQINTDSILARIDSLLEIENNIDFSPSNIRFLDNRQMYWYDKQNEVESSKSTLANIIRNLDEIKYELEDKIEVWKNTKELIKEEEKRNQPQV
jgi:hypothetical protein